MLEEQAYVEHLYSRLDEMRSETERLRDSYRVSDNTPGGRVQREIAQAHHTAALTSLTLAEDRLCFGRMDRSDGTDAHIGRLGIFESGASDRQLLMDWRAPAARPFYTATAAAPEGVVRRRHLSVRRRRVHDVTDEYLDSSPEALAAAGLDPGAAVDADSGLAGESALMAAMNAPRTGRMGDIVATIQAEQDRIIRADRGGVLVVQGGPGTGKTAVALHRVAYLLYTYRDQLASRGVLVVGPNRTFLSYIGQVLPSLGENAVVLATAGELFPGVRAEAVDPPEVAVIKGRTTMATVIANAVLDRQRVPRQPIVVDTRLGRLRIEPGLLRSAQTRAWGSRLPHNRARAVFLRVVVNGLARQVAARHRTGLAAEIPFTEEDFADTRGELRSDEALSKALSGIWPVLSATRLLAELYARAERLEVAGRGLSAPQRGLLARPLGRPWTISDVPLLDEAAELLGAVPVTSADSGPAEDLQEFAQDVLDSLAQEHPDAEADTGHDDGAASMIGATDLAALQQEAAALTSTAERAAADREWTYGHVVVDEAQELSPMAWRMVMRRCPVRSLTIVGDIAQTSDPSGARSWPSALQTYAHDQLRVEELTVNYRTPAEIAAVADRVLARIDPDLRPPESVRSTGIAPWWRGVTRDELVGAVVEAVGAELGRSDEQHLAVIVPAAWHQAVTAAVADGLVELRDRAVVLTVTQAKGLEFDVVLLVDPDKIERDSRRGLADVYVALTRATQRLGVLYPGGPPRIAAGVDRN